MTDIGSQWQDHKTTDKRITGEVVSDSAFRIQYSAGVIPSRVVFGSHAPVCF
jgi:hypothetical protein